MTYMSVPSVRIVSASSSSVLGFQNRSPVVLKVVSRAPVLSTRFSILQRVSVALTEES